MKDFRTSKSLCAACAGLLDARVFEEDGLVYMARECPAHGKTRVLLSTFPDLFAEWDEFVSPHRYSRKHRIPGRYVILYVTRRCNMACPICFINEDINPAQELSVSRIRGLLRSVKGRSIRISGGEPTMREDLPEIIRTIRDTGNRAVLSTNGIKLADPEYLGELRRSGLSLVLLSFDGFDTELHHEIRGGDSLCDKTRALENLRRAGMPTTLFFTVLKNHNEREMDKTLDYAHKNLFVASVCFIGFRQLGKKDVRLENECRPEEIVDYLERNSRYKISKRSVLSWMKLINVWRRLRGEPQTCPRYQEYLFFRLPGGLLAADELIDTAALRKDVERVNRLLAVNTFSARLLFYLWTLPRLVMYADRRMWRARLQAALANKRSLLRGKFLSGGTLLPVKFLTICTPRDIEDIYGETCNIEFFFRDGRQNLNKAFMTGQARAWNEPR
jgi:MoaA/NifB/PqqE/SkfB family radical SAM enzyme